MTTLDQNNIAAIDDARAAANRRNAQLSTGPKTPEGKARSAQNARTTGWFARDLRVADGQEEMYLEFEQAWRDELNPEGLLELEAFHDFVRASWHKREVVAAQNETTASSPAAFLDEAIARQLDRLHRYERDFESRAARHLRELRRLQAARQTAAATPSAEPAPEPRERTQPKAPPPGIPDEILRDLYIMEVETAYWNSQLRARKAGLLSAAANSAPPPSEMERAA